MHSTPRTSTVDTVVRPASSLQIPHNRGLAEDTLTRMFWNRLEHSPDAVAHLVKRQGHWQPLTWTVVGDAIALLSSTRAEWVQADFAILSAGGVTVPIYATYPPELIAYIVNDAVAKLLIVETPSQLEKVLEAREKMPSLEHVVVIEGYEGQLPFVLTWEALRRLGREQADRLKTILAERMTAVCPDDVATVVYTSGTTGLPKGVVQTHGNHMAALCAVTEVTPVQPGDVHLLFLPLAHAFARLEAFMGVYLGLTTAFAERLDTLMDNLREVYPHFFCSVPRLFEKVHARLLSDVEAGSPIKRHLFAWALATGLAVSRRRQSRRPIPLALRLTHRLAYRLVFAKLHAALGGRLRFAVSGGAPLAPEIAEFFHAAGLLILEGYGLTETCPILTFNRIDHFKFGSVGQAIPGVELRLAPDGEILARGPNIARRGYLHQPQTTAEAFGPDGWFRTGDLGRLDAEGFVFLTDRKKDLIITSGGINIAPQHLENLLTTDPLISQAMVYGDARPYPVALLTLHAEELARFATSQGIRTTDDAALRREPIVVARVQRVVEAKNASLPSYARIKKFAIIAAEFTEAAGEVTPTQKIKRRMVAERYGDVLESLYREGLPQ
jgi:long-chain acyl-CoA synthetase